jgi:hypothetical protein
MSTCLQCRGAGVWAGSVRACAQCEGGGLKGRVGEGQDEGGRRSLGAACAAHALGASAPTAPLPPPPWGIPCARQPRSSPPHPPRTATRTFASRGPATRPGCAPRAATRPRARGTPSPAAPVEVGRSHRLDARRGWMHACMHIRAHALPFTPSRARAAPPPLPSTKEGVDTPTHPHAPTRPPPPHTPPPAPRSCP